MAYQEIMSLIDDQDPSRITKIFEYEPTYRYQQPPDNLMCKIHHMAVYCNCTIKTLLPMVENELMKQDQHTRRTKQNYL